MNDEWANEFFEDEFEKQDPWKFFTSSYEQKKYIRQINLIKDRKPNPKKILEIGCAEGAHTKIINEVFPSAKIVAVDISYRAIKRAEKNIHSDKINFIQADIINYINFFQNNEFDVIFWSESIYYIGDRLSTRHMFDFLEKVIKKLDKNGLICLANIINQADEVESSITKRSIMKQYFNMLRDCSNLVHFSVFVEFKKESNQKYEYQIWIFKR